MSREENSMMLYSERKDNMKSVVKKYIIPNDRKPEFLGQIIDIFEDFLNDKNIHIENQERSEYADGDEEGLAIIFGTDYDIIQSKLENMMVSWNIIEPNVLDTEREDSDGKS